jgi:hypothetical protein
MAALRVKTEIESDFSFQGRPRKSATVPPL